MKLLAWLAGLLDLMVIECGWCKKLLGFKRGYGVKGVTSGICKKCNIKLLEGRGKSW